MERRMIRKTLVRCGAGEKMIQSYLLPCNANNNNASNSNGVRPDFTLAQFFLDKNPQCELAKGRVVLSIWRLINTNRDDTGYDQCIY